MVVISGGSVGTIVTSHLRGQISTALWSFVEFACLPVLYNYPLGTILSQLKE